jgi:hypothetical protein
VVRRTKSASNTSFGFGVSGADLIHRGVHPRVEAKQLCAPAGQGTHGDGAAVGRVAAPGHPAAAFQTVEDAGHGGGVQPGASGQGARAERASDYSPQFGLANGFLVLAVTTLVLALTTS